VAAVPKAGPVNGGSTVYVSGVLHNVFGSGVVGGSTDYRLVEIRNVGSSTWTSPKAWLVLDTGGAAVAIAVADSGTARALDFVYSVDPAGLSYSTPTDSAGGLSLPSLAAGQKCLIGVRRTLTGASVDYPDNNTLMVSGTSPV
jgi:hypothetical protein